MKFFNWMQSKFRGGLQGNNNKRPNAANVTNHMKKEFKKQEFGDWPNELLSIGTFGCNKREIRAEQNQSETYQTSREDEHRCCSPDFSEFTSEEVIKLQRELKKLITRKHDALNSDYDSSLLVTCADNHPTHPLPLDRFLNWPSSLEEDRTNVSNRFSVDDRGREEEEIDRTIRIILGRCKDVREKKGKKDIGKKSMSFLVKKMLNFASEFVEKTSLRDTFHESRMEKLLRTMLVKKIYPQTASRASSTKQYLQDHRSAMYDRKGVEDESDREVYKWDKTDNEYIVLEI